MLRNGPPALSDFDEGIRLGLESLLTTNYRQKEANKTNEGLKVIGGLGDGKFDQNNKECATKIIKGVPPT